MTQLTLLQGDITTAKTDAIVNAANSSLLGGGGVDGAIHKAGGPQILEACMQIRQKQGGCKTGEAVITTAGNLPCKYVIHTVGPVYNNGRAGEADFLASCYYNSLRLATQHSIKTIAFPNISTGIYGYPKKPAAAIAVQTVASFIKAHPTQFREIQFICYDKENFDIYQNLLP